MNFQPEWTDPTIPSQGRNGKSEDLSKFGSNIVNEHQISISSDQKSSNFSRSPSNLSPLKDKEPPLSSPYQRSYADSHRTNVGFPIRQPGFMSDKNLPFSPPKFVEVESEDLSLFGSRAVNSDRFSGPPRALSRPELIYDADSHRTNVGFSFHQPGFTSAKNLPFTSPKLIEVESQDLSQFGSGAVNSEHHSGPPHESPHFSDISNNLSPLKDKKPLLPLPSQRSDADLQWTNVSFPFHHPGLTSDMNLSFTSPKLIEPPLLCQSGNGKSTDLLQFGSRTVDSDHLPGPPQHHQLAFSPKTTREGTESPADTMVIHPEIVPHNGSMSPLLDGNGVEVSPLLDGNGVEEFNMYPLLDGNGVDELNQGSLRKRQKASDNDEKDICCKCKKTECLKLIFNVSKPCSSSLAVIVLALPRDFIVSVLAHAKTAETRLLTCSRKMGPCRPQAHQGTNKAAIARRQSVCPDIVYASRVKLDVLSIAGVRIAKILLARERDNGSVSLVRGQM
ncbi:hypothetical protein TIFTF001_019218 [Ficus carica]|uniref:Uncharacterized protein n=1 Tax=Ficus carica TaxID=3494 RepID=A0AA88AD10_FICCA|nr:hypothetical protein TIFTF001_019218 [Ficus carica]